jgi:hypothetical protein
MTDLAMFRRVDATTYEPTAASTGSWDPKLIHGAPLAALLAGRFAQAPGTLARFSVDFVAPVPMAPLTVEMVDEGGGSRVQRRRAVVTAGDRIVATGAGVLVREGDLDLPEKARRHPSPFDPAAVPDLSEPHPDAKSTVGWDSFVNLGVAIEPMRVEGDRRPHQWVALAAPVLDDEEPLGVELAVVAADFAQTAVHAQLPFTHWSFRNADLTVHLTRPPVGSWIGLRSEALVQDVGAGFNAADLFDSAGRVARSASVLVVEARSS